MIVYNNHRASKQLGFVFYLERIVAVQLFYGKFPSSWPTKSFTITIQELWIWLAFLDSLSLSQAKKTLLQNHKMSLRSLMEDSGHPKHNP